jgi:hypothetical protein
VGEPCSQLCLALITAIDVLEADAVPATGKAVASFEAN